MHNRNFAQFIVTLILLVLTTSLAQPVNARNALPSAPNVGAIPYFRYPVVGVWEGVAYGLDPRMHGGADTYAIDFIYPKEGIDIYPTLPGKVVYVDKEKDYGWVIVIRHWDDKKWDQKYYSLYAHLKPGSIKVKLGDIVDGKLPIGQMGNSGEMGIPGNDGKGPPHLHFAVRASSNVYDGLTALYGKIGKTVVTPSFDICPKNRDKKLTVCHLH